MEGDDGGIVDRIFEQVRTGVLRWAETRLISGERVLRVELHPAHLGAMQITVAETDDGVNICVACTEHSTHRLLQSHESHFRQHLSEAGISLGDLQLSGDQSSGQFGPSHPPAPPRPAAIPSDLAATSPTPKRALPASTHQIDMLI
jgi:hypothetical protein